MKMNQMSATRSREDLHQRKQSFELKTSKLVLAPGPGEAQGFKAYKLNESRASRISKHAQEKLEFQNFRASKHGAPERFNLQSKL
eukprot:jgi/Botrbrau1/20844/Bobra.0156s0069.1